MTRDFKGRAEPRAKAKTKGRSQRSCTFWFAIGALLGAFGVGLLWLQLDPALWRSGSGLADTGVPRPPEDGVKRPAPSNSLEFIFPDLLRDMTVPVPDEVEPPVPKQAAVKPRPRPEKPPAREPPAAKPKPKPQLKPKSQPKPKPKPKPKQVKTAEREAYLLQLGSFRKAADAETLKARLAFMGVETRVQKVTINNKDTFHRVRSGPYRSKKELDEVRSMLTRNKIKSIAIKWKG